MGEDRRGNHPQDPAEGSPEDVEAPGVENARDDLGEPKEDTENEVDEPGVDLPGDA